MERFDLVQPLENGVGRIIDFLPQLLAALLILLVGYIISKVLERVTRKALRRARFDRALHGATGGSAISRLVESPSGLAGRIVFWLVFLGAISLAISAINLPVLNNLLASLYSYVPNIIASILIFLVASAISAGAAAFVQRFMGRTALAKLIATVIPAIVLSLAAFMILNQLGIAREIVNILFTAIIGSIALGLALAFGLGGRDVARELLEQATDSARAKSGQAKAEVRQAAEKSGREARRLKNEL